MHILSIITKTSPASLHNAAFPAGVRGHQRLRGRPIKKSTHWPCGRPAVDAML